MQASTGGTDPFLLTTLTELTSLSSIDTPYIYFYVVVYDLTKIVR
jgi:hypothetical protein